MKYSLGELMVFVGLESADARDEIDVKAPAAYPAPWPARALGVGGNAFFAVTNTGLARRGGHGVSRWQSIGRAAVSHRNRCTMTGARAMQCANSNFPRLPMAGSPG